MVYSMLTIRPTSGLVLRIPLNEVYDGWVCQILNGTFGGNKEYNFTGNVVTTVTDKPIDINVRLTPTVPIPARSARFFLDVLANGNDLSVDIIDDSIMGPSIDYVRNETTTYTQPKIAFNRKVHWKQDCVVREIKYDYSERLATIEFTITTKKPVLYGPEFSIYMGLGNQNWQTSIANTQKMLDQLYQTIGYFDLNKLQVGLPPIGDASFQLFQGGFLQFNAKVVGSSRTDNGLFKMTRTEDNERLFEITGGYQPLSSTCYASEAYPALTIPDVSTFMRSLRPPAKFTLQNYGQCYVAMDCVMIRKGL